MNRDLGVLVEGYRFVKLTQSNCLCPDCMKRETDQINAAKLCKLGMTWRYMEGCVNRTFRGCPDSSDDLSTSPIEGIMEVT